MTKGFIHKNSFVEANELEKSIYKAKILHEPVRGKNVFKAILDDCNFNSEFSLDEHYQEIEDRLSTRRDVIGFNTIGKYNDTVLGLKWDNTHLNIKMNDGFLSIDYDKNKTDDTVKLFFDKVINYSNNISGIEEISFLKNQLESYKKLGTVEEITNKINDKGYNLKKAFLSGATLAKAFVNLTPEQLFNDYGISDSDL